ncbi:MAG: small subunit ribosomal protein, partial [Thermoleophilaceae bacterium]|nr:small subunit ribosomal protein [Thermoleophilaceae bacterium]
FGAFVDLDGIDGLIHISELSWSHVNHPSEILSIGDVVPVKVLDIDRDRQRISLGLKQTQEDPWQRVVDTYNLGDELEGKVTKVVSFGAFVEILDGVEGLVHISELANHHVENPREVVNQGDVIRVKILEIDSERRRLSLSAKRVEDQVLPLRSAADMPGPGTHVEGELDGNDEYGEVRDLGLSEDVFAPGADPTELGDGTAAEEQVAADEALDVNQSIPVDAPPAPEAAAPVEEEASPVAEAEAPVAEKEAPQLAEEPVAIAEEPAAPAPAAAEEEPPAPAEAEESPAPAEASAEAAPAEADTPDPPQ